MATRKRRVGARKTNKSTTTRKSGGGRASYRDQFEATTIEDFNDEVEQEDKTLSSGAASEWLDIEDGANKFRIFPKRKGEKTYYVVREQTWVTVENDDGEASRRTVLSAKRHGGQEKDIIEEYRLGAIQFLTDNEDYEADDKIGTINHWQDGLKSQLRWLFYAKKVQKSGDEFGIVEAKKSVRDGMVKIAQTEDVDEPIVVDPFTDIDDGYPIIVTYKPKAKRNTDKYVVTLSKRPMPLTDEELEAYAKTKTLTEMYGNAYRMSDFDRALEGLQNFDEEYEIGYFDSDEFQDIIDELKEALEESGIAGGDNDEKSKAKSKSKSKLNRRRKSKEEVEEEDDDEPEDEDEEEIDLDSMSRSELKAFIKEEELDIRVLKNWSDDDIREAIVEAMDDDDAFEDDEDEDEPEDEEPEKSVRGKKKAADLDDIKARIKARRKR